MEFALLLVGAACGAASVVIGATVAGAMRERAERRFWARQGRLIVLHVEQVNRPPAVRQEVMS